MLWPAKIFYQLWCMVKNIKQENPPCSRPLFNHIDVFAKSFVVVCCIDGGVGVAFYVIVKRHFFIAYQLFEIIPVPFTVGRPVMRQVFYNHRNARLIIFFSKHLWLNRIKGGYRL